MGRQNDRTATGRMRRIETCAGFRLKCFKLQKSDQRRLHEMRKIIILCVGLALLSVAVCFDWADLLPSSGLPAHELSNPGVRADLATLRGVCVIFATGLIISVIVLWKYPGFAAGLADKFEVLTLTMARTPFFVPLSLTTLVLAKTSLQLGLYLIGYSAYGADDFSRSLSADYWLYFVGSISAGTAGLDSEVRAGFPSRIICLALASLFIEISILHPRLLT